MQGMALVLSPYRANDETKFIKIVIIFNTF